MPTHAPHGIDACDIASHPDLRPGAGVPRASHDLDQPFGDLRHLEGEQVHHELGRGSAHEQLGATRLRAHVLQIAPKPVARTHDLARNDLLPVDDRLGVAAQVEDEAALVPDA